MSLPSVPAIYDAGRWRQILGAIDQAVSGAFQRLQDVRLALEARFSMRASTGEEVFFTVDAAGNLLTPYAGVLKVTRDAGATLTIDGPGAWIHTGTGATWTLPDMAAGEGWALELKNRGSGDLVVQCAGSDEIWTTTNVTSITLKPGQVSGLRSDGGYFSRMF